MLLQDAVGVAVAAVEVAAAVHDAVRSLFVPDCAIERPRNREMTCPATV